MLFIAFARYDLFAPPLHERKGRLLVKYTMTALTAPCQLRQNLAAETTYPFCRHRQSLSARFAEIQTPKQPMRGLLADGYTF